MLAFARSLPRIRARVTRDLARPELDREHVLATVQQVVFLDKGRADGVTLGDVFEAYRPASGEIGARSEEVRVQLLVAHTREHTSSAIVIGMSNPQLIPGMPVRLIKKMPS
jgi:hypothetical protein